MQAALRYVCGVKGKRIIIRSLAATLLTLLGALMDKKREKKENAYGTYYIITGTSSCL